MPKSLFARFWRFITPSNLIAAIILFFLPWTEVRCDSTYQDNSKGSDLVVSQSGIQAASGTYTDKLVRNPFAPPDPNKKVFQQIPQPMSALFLYGSLLVVGAVVGIVLRNGHLRSVLLVLCSSAAFIILLVQAQTGFSVEALLPSENTALKEQYYEFQRQKGNTLTKGPPILNVYFTPWYRASFVLPLLATLTALTEWGLYGRRKRLITKDAGFKKSL